MAEPRSLKIIETSKGTKEIEGRYQRFNKKLGKGAFKTVWRAFDTIAQVDVAWNSIDLSVMTDNERAKVFSECEMLQKLNHKNILKIRDKWHNVESDELCFVTDMVQNGSIRSFFKKRKINLKSVKQICRQILLALDYLHGANVIHRDLKCDNIFIDGNSGIVLGDLGLSVNFNGAESRMSIVGTPHWMAPELYNEKYNELVDIWSFGMCVLELTSNAIPYAECKNTIAVYNKVMNEKQKPDILYTIRDPYIKSFINICLDFNPSLRPTAKELLSHPFLLSRYPRDYILCDKLMKQQQEEEQQQQLIDNNNNLRPPKKRKHRKHKNDVKVTKVVPSKRNIITIKLQIYTKEKKGAMTVTFDFNMNIDRASEVAQEMISELNLSEIYRLKVENAINKAIKTENIHNTQIVGHSLVMKLKEFESQSSDAAAAVAAAAAASVKESVKKTESIDIVIENDLVLNDNINISSKYAFDEKQKEQIARKREELLKEYQDLIHTKQELLKLRVESINDNAAKKEVKIKMKQTIEKKKKEIIKQYENYISDHVTLAQYSLTKLKTNMAQNFIFEKDPKYLFFMKSPYLTKNEKYQLENSLKDKRQKIVDQYLKFYQTITKQYAS